MREVIAAASAAGVAVAFGSPIGGILFALEEMSTTWNIKIIWRAFWCALCATMTLSVLNPFRTGKLVLFQVSYDRDWHFFEIGGFVLIGIFGVGNDACSFAHLTEGLIRVCTAHSSSSIICNGSPLGGNTWPNMA